MGQLIGFGPWGQRKEDRKQGTETAAAVAATAKSIAGRVLRPPRPDPGESRAEQSSSPILLYRTAAGAVPLAASAAAAATPGRSSMVSKRPASCD
jgi:hypothetical protein